MKIISVGFYGNCSSLKMFNKPAFPNPFPKVQKKLILVKCVDQENRPGLLFFYKKKNQQE